jgi:hypothetical protein
VLLAAAVDGVGHPILGYWVFLKSNGDPPALPGWQLKFDISGGGHSDPQIRKCEAIQDGQCAHRVYAITVAFIEHGFEPYPWGAGSCGSAELRAARDAINVLEAAPAASRCWWR